MNYIFFKEIVLGEKYVGLQLVSTRRVNAFMSTAVMESMVQRPLGFWSSQSGWAVPSQSPTESGKVKGKRGGGEGVVLGAVIGIRSFNAGKRKMQSYPVSQCSPEKPFNTLHPHGEWEEERRINS